MGATSDALMLEQKNVEYHQALAAALAKNTGYAVEVESLKARILELEAAYPAPTFVPAPNKPKLLVERFDSTALNTGVFYLDKTPPDRVVVGGGRCLLKWQATSDPADMRAQIGIRFTPGSSNQTPRRDSIGSMRLYAWDVFYPPAFKTDDEFCKHKCVGPQWHQGSDVSSPPLSIEQVSGEMRLHLSLQGQERKYWPLGPTPRTATKVLAHIKWSPGSDGFIKMWINGELKVDHHGPSCNPASIAQDINHLICLYSPGHKNGDYPIGYTREVSFGYWLIGDGSNKPEDMV
jgi:hypothetical protein